MAALGEYIVSVAVTALLTGIISGFLKGTSGEKIVRLICNLVLLLAVLRPVMQWNMRKMPDAAFFFPDGSRLVLDGRGSSRNALEDIIKQKSEAYILDKAAAMGLEITAKVGLSSDDPPVPVWVEISGTVSPYMKLRLEEMILEDLNISKENQVWTG